MAIVEKIVRLLGSNNVEAFAARLVTELGDQREASLTDPNGMLVDLAKREKAIGLDQSELTLTTALIAVSAFDKRIPVMISIQKLLDLPENAIASHEDLIKRLYEDSRFVGKEPQGDLPSLILSIVKCSEASLDKDDLELFVEEGQPTTFFYETARAFLETARESPGDADEDESEEQQEEEEEEEQEEEDQPVRAAVKTFMVQNLVLLVDEKRLDIEPAWQRTDVWSLKKKRELIRSLILGIPLPSIILHSRAGGKMSIIDGKQRLLSIIKFVKNEFKLPRYEVEPSSPLYSCRGAFYDKVKKPSLPDDMKGELRMREIPALVFDDVSEKRLRNIFHLYNVSGMKLNSAEIRNAVYQANPIHRVIHVLAGEGNSQTDLGIGGLAIQEDFKRKFRSKYLGAGRRYQGVDFLARYLGYSRVAHGDHSKPFGTPSTSRAIDNYFDYCSSSELDHAVAKEIVEVFHATEEFFDIDDNRLAFYVRDNKDRRKFSKLAATTHMVATRLLLHLMVRGVIDKDTAKAASESAYTKVPDKQQSATIWGYQAQVMLALRDALGKEAIAKASAEWQSFFIKMEQYRLEPDGDDQ